MTSLAVIPVLKQLIDLFDALIRFFHDTFGFGWGMSIITLTVCVRIVLLPLTIKQFKSMQAMQKIGPEMKKLQAKYKDDKQRLNQEMMKLYQEHQVNPFGSCLPLVAQMPVFISLFYMLRKDLKLDICGDALAHYGLAQHGLRLATTACTDVPDYNGSYAAAKFLFIPDLTNNATGLVLVVLITLYIGSQLMSSVLMSVTADRNQRMMMIGLPFVFTVFIINFPAGLLVYWITTNLWTVGQQYVVRRTLGDKDLAAMTHAVTPVHDGATQAAPTGMFARLAARAMEQQEADAASGGGAAKTKAKASGTTSAPKTAAPPPPPRAKKKKRSGRRR